MKKHTRSSQPMLFTALLVAATISATATVSAQENPGPLSIVAMNLTAQADGRTPAEGTNVMVSRPGDLIEYRLSFTNNTTGSVRDVVFDDPIPEGLVYVAGSAGAEREDVSVEFSIDGGSSYDANPVIEVQEAGAMVRRPAPPDRYTHVRWNVLGAVSVDEEVQAVFRARIAGALNLIQ